MRNKKRQDGLASLLKTLREKKFIILYIFLTAAVLGGVYFVKNMQKKKLQPDQPLTLVQQYQNQLIALKDKASSGKAVDLQAYGIALYATGDFPEAEKVYRKQAEVDSQNSMLHNNLANTLRDQKKTEEAIKEYEKAIELAPGSVNSYVNLASIYQYSLNDPESAINVYKKAIEKNPNVVDFQNLAGLAYEQKGELEQAIEYFKKALVIQSDNQAAKSGIERIEKRN